MSGQLVSVVMPAFNAAPYIREAVASVLAQSHTEWELWIVDDGSTDATLSIARSFSDPRIHVLTQANHGIGHARNRALERVSGDFLCLLDSDDVLPSNSIRSRLNALLNDEHAMFCDGVVKVFGRQLEVQLREYVPTFTGDPFIHLAALDPICFFGPSWMIRWRPNRKARFNEEVTHVEDLLFYLTLAKGNRYIHTKDTVLHYRVTGHSSMSKLEGLESSYHYVHAWLASNHADLGDAFLSRTKRRIRRIMAKSYLKEGRGLPALRALFR
ncbi:MAG: glycosyltransferase family 2 protein [Flavobacteriales bacterium]|nr:glycosyltransferase family 2 protein [Flavobacteriales bacterium]